MKIISASEDPREYDSNGWGRPGTRASGIPGGLVGGAHGSPSALPRPAPTASELDAQTEEPF